MPVKGEAHGSGTGYYHIRGRVGAVIGDDQRIRNAAILIWAAIRDGIGEAYFCGRLNSDGVGRDIVACILI